MEKKTSEKLSELDAILRRLRVECPWDRKQTWESLRTQTIEEVYELAQALEYNDEADVRKELGDVLLHIYFYALIGEEKKLFDLGDVADSICRKLVYRHPHVFGEAKAETAVEVSQNWEKLKLKEKDGNKSVLGGVPRSLPALIKAYRIQGKVRGVGFDWKDPEGAWAKLSEETEEFRKEVTTGDRDAMEAEMGDLLFSLINVARQYDINPETALERTNKKFISRFEYLEEHAKADGKELTDMTLEEMDRYWDEAKKTYK